MDYRGLFRHCIRVEVRGEEYLPYRFEPSALEEFRKMNHAGAGYGACCAGIALDFWTDAAEISINVSLKNGLTYGRMECFDIHENGRWSDSIAWDGFTPLRYRRKEAGKGRITIFAPVIYELGFSNFQIGNWQLVEAEPHRIMLLGDSIMQGLRSLHPCCVFGTLLAQYLDMDYVNFGIGGEYHRPALAESIPEYHPDRILLNLGTNDVNMLETDATYKERIRGCYAGIAKRWTGIPVNVITPVWRTEFYGGSALGDQRLACAKNVRNIMIEVCHEFGFVPHDGLLIAPNTALGLADHCHPNDLGFALYALNLAKVMMI